MKRIILIILCLLIICNVVVARTIYLDGGSTLSQAQLCHRKAKYVVSSDYDLRGNTICFAAKSRITFKGGSFSNGVVNLSKNCTISGDSTTDRNNNLQIVPLAEGILISDFNWSSSKVCLLSYYNCSGLCMVNCSLESVDNNCVKLVADHLEGEVIEDISFVGCRFVFNRMGIELQNHYNEEYRFRGVRVKSCSFSPYDDTPEYGFAVSLSGYGSGAVVDSCVFLSSIYGVEVVGFSDVSVAQSSFNEIGKHVISCSNFRPMQSISFNNNSVQSPSAKMYIENVSYSTIKNNEIDVAIIELQSCNNIEIANNNIVSHSRNSIILDNSSHNHVHDNKVEQKNKSNYSIFRCYGKNATGNTFEGNRAHKVSNSGSIFDQINEAANNDFIQ